VVDGDITGAPRVAETADRPRRAVVQGRPIRVILRKALLHTSPDHLGERHATFTSLGPQPSRLVFGELNLCSDHGSV